MSRLSYWWLVSALVLLSACDNSSNVSGGVPTNAAPQSANASLTTAEDTPLVASLSVSDPDSDPLTITVTDDVDNGVLTIVADGNGGFDASYEPNPDFNGTDEFVFTVSDQSLTAGPFTVTITVSAENDAPVAAAQTVNGGEDTPLMASVTATDVDGDALTYVSVTVPTNGALALNADGSFSYTPNVDFNGADQFSFTANDGTVDSNTAVVTINVAPVNDAPVAAADAFMATEDVPLSIPAAGLLANDMDIDGDALTATIASPPANGVVNIAADGSFVYLPNANFNGADLFTYVANDGTVASPPATATISVAAVNDIPVAIAGAASITEDGSVDLVLTGSDIENGALTFSIVAGPASGVLSGFDAATGALTYTPNADFSGDDSFMFRANDGMADSADALVTITVTPVNDPPTDIAIDNAVLAEEQPAGTTVGTLSSVDVDAGDTHTYNLVAGAGDTDNASFAIVGDQLQTAAVFDFETQNSFAIRVQTDDGAGGTFEEALTITVNDVNDPPTEIALDSTDVDESQPAGTPVGTLSSTDVDSPGPFLYSLVAGTGDTDNASFAIVGGQLQTAAVFDFETQNSFAIRVQTDDGAGGTYEEALTITVNDVNDPPTDIALDSTDVDESQPAGTPVGTLTSTDVDSAGPFVYSLVAGAGDTDNASFAIVGDQLQTAAVFDFETQNSFAIRVQTDDGAGGTFEEALTITANDVNDPPTDIALDSTDVDESQPAGTPVGTLTSTDVDSPGPFVYSLVAGAGDTDNASFSIVGDQLQTAAVFDFETQNSFAIRVQTDDGAGGTFEEAFTITVNSLNDPPTDIGIDSSDVDENQVAGTLVGTFTTTDPDPDTHIYTLVAGTGDTDNAQFTISGDQLLTNAVLNFEAADNCLTSLNTCSIRVQTDDQVSGTFQKSFIINIGDINDPPGAADDNFTGAIGNTQLALVSALSGTPLFPAAVELVGSVGDNDPDEDGDTVGAVAATVATTQGGSVTIDAAGRFVYQPPAGFTGGNDTFTYTPFDGTDPSTSTATVTIGVAGIVWYVDDSSPNAPGTGTSADPFRNLSSAGSGPTLPGEIIFVYAGTQTTGIVLQNNQTLLGEGVALVVGPTTLSSAGTRPVITTAGTAITLGMSNTVRGLNISGSNTGIVGSSGGTLTADNMSISTTGGPGIDLTNGAGLVTLDSLSSTNSASEGIDLNAVSGTFTFGSGAISSSTGNAFEVTNSNAVIDYSGSVSAGLGLAVNISGQSANSVSLAGAINSSAQGISLNGNAGGTINLSGGMSLSTGSNAGIFASSGGTLNICADTNCSAAGGTPVVNSINTTNAVALNVTNVDIGTDGLTFRSISCTSSTSSGIVLNTTGTLGGLTVTGDGSTSQGGNDTGGIIQNTSGDGISLISTRDVTLQNMTIGDPSATPANLPDAIVSIAGDGIEARAVTNLTLQSVTIARTRDHGLNAVSVGGAPSVTNLVVDDSLILNAGDGQEEHGLNLDELRGDNFVRDSLFDGFNETGIELVNSSGQVDLTVNNTTFQDNQATVGNAGEEAILIDALGSAQVAVLIDNSTFDDIARQAVDARSIGTSSDVQLTVRNSNFVETASGDGVIIMNPDNSGSGNITVTGNTFTDNTFGPFAVLLKNDSSGSLDATVQSNTTTNMQLVSINHDDIGSNGAANGTSRLLVGGPNASFGNVINVGTNNIAIDVIATESGPTGSDPDLSVTVMNNTSSQPDDNFTFSPGLRIDAQNNARLNANISNNALQGDPTCCGGAGIEIRELDAAPVRLQGFAGGNTSAATAFIDSQNPGSSLPSFLFSGVDDQWGSGTATLPTTTTLPSP